MRKSLINARAAFVRSLLAATLGFALAFTFSSCDTAGNPSALVGRWVGVSGNEKGAVVELLSDGTGIITYKEASGGYAITWKTEKGRIYVTASGAASASGYKLKGSLLTFTEDDGKINEYAKCHKDCQEAAKEYAEAKDGEFGGIGIKIVLHEVPLTDSRDNKTYKTTKIGTQTWMAENLNYNANGSKCNNNQESNCSNYGRLYNWATAMNACPSGWHLPNESEWEVLTATVGGEETEGKYLKATSGWDSYNGQSGNGQDTYGFSALPGGFGYSDGNFSYAGYGGYWWSATEDNGSNAYIRYMYYDDEYARWYNFDKSDLFSVRCLQD